MNKIDAQPGVAGADIAAAGDDDSRPVLHLFRLWRCGEGMNAYYMIVALQGWVRVDGEGCFNVDSIRLAYIVWQRMPRAHKARSCRAHR